MYSLTKLIQTALYFPIYKGFLHDLNVMPTFLWIKSEINLLIFLHAEHSINTIETEQIRKIFNFYFFYFFFHKR